MSAISSGAPVSTGQTPHVRAHPRGESSCNSDLNRFGDAIERCLDLVVIIHAVNSARRGGVQSSEHLHALAAAVADASALPDAAAAVCALHFDTRLVEFEGVTAESACAAALKLSKQVLSAAGFGEHAAGKPTR